MPDPISVFPTAAGYVLSNGTVVAEKTLFYTPSQIFKIEVCGAIAIIAVLVLTYTCYKWYMARFRTWKKQQELIARVEAGELVDPAEYPEEPAGLSRGLLLLVGALAMIAGVAAIIIP